MSFSICRAQPWFAAFVFAFVQHRVNRQTEPALHAGNLHHQPHHDPLVSKRRGHAFFGRADGIVKPADAEHMLPRLMQQRSVHSQQQFARRIEFEHCLDGDTVGQGFHGPSRAAKEVIKPIERMPLVAIHAVSINRFKGLKLGMPSQTHYPAQKNLSMCHKAGRGESGHQGLKQTCH